MGEKTLKKMTGELYQAVIGIPENPEENGLIGDVREIRKITIALNGKVRGNEVRSKVNQVLISVLLLGFGAGITKLVDIW